MDAAEDLFAVQWSGFCNPALNTLFIANRQVLVGNFGTYWNRDADLFMFMQPVKRRWAITPRWKSNVDGTREDLFKAASAGDNVALAFQRSAGSEDWQEWFDQRWNPATPRLLKLREECPAVPSMTISGEIQASVLPLETAGDVTPGLVPVRVASSIDKQYHKVASVGQGEACGSSVSSSSALRNRSDQQEGQECTSANDQKPITAHSDKVNKASLEPQTHGQPQSQKPTTVTQTRWGCVCGYQNYMRNTICGGSGRSGCGRPRPSHLNRIDQEAGRKNNSWSSQPSWASKDTRTWESENRWNYIGHAQGRHGWWPTSSEDKGWQTNVEKTNEGDKKDHKDKTHKKDKKAKKEKKTKIKHKKEKKSKKEKKKKKDEASSSDTDQSERGEESVQQPPRRLPNATVTDASKSASSSMTSSVPHAPSNQSRKSLALAALAGSLGGSCDDAGMESSPTQNATPTPTAAKQASHDDTTTAASTSIALAPTTTGAQQASHETIDDTDDLIRMFELTSDESKCLRLGESIHDILQRRLDMAATASPGMDPKSAKAASEDTTPANPPSPEARAPHAEVVVCTSLRKRKPWPEQVHREDCGCVVLGTDTCNPHAKAIKGNIASASAVAHASSQRIGTKAPPVPRWRL